MITILMTALAAKESIEQFTSGVMLAIALYSVTPNRKGNKSKAKKR